jgi:hypothetical protein
MSPTRQPSRRRRAGNSTTTAHATPVERLEPRVLLATFVVNNTTDAGGTGTVASRSLRQAINAANANNNDSTVIDVIEFNIPGSGTRTIIPASALPTISEAVEIDGTTQPGFAGSPLIELNGTNAGNAVFGLRITAGRSTIRSLAINRFGGNSTQGGGIRLENAGSNVIVGCRIGTNPGGVLDLGNSGAGISIAVPPGNRSGSRIGGTTTAELNIILGNGTHGIDIQNSDSNVVLGNRIGLTAQGSFAVPNGQVGVNIVNGNDNLIGGTQSGSRNYISGNGGQGVFILRAGTNTASDNTIQGNYIGLDLAGNADLGNGSVGILLNDAGGNTIGGKTPAARNVISGNASTGVQISNAGAINNLVRGNYIGTNAAGNAAVPNGNGGVQINMASANIVGGSIPAGEGNLISGNTGNGVWITRTGANANLVRGNIIGLAANGAALGNTLNGVMLTDGQNNTIGDADLDLRNVISANGQHGILLNDGSDAADSGSNDNTIRGNYIGTDVFGSLDRGNAGEGVQIGVLCDNNDVIGNIIAFNNGDGVWVVGFSSPGTGNTISANAIYSNDQLGIDLHDNGVTPNDTNDPDAGANDQLNFPILTAVTSIAARTRVAGSLNTNANSGQHRIEFFSSPTSDASGFGEGRTFLGSTTLNVGATNSVNFNLLVSPTLPGDFVTATATRLSTGSTSEFSAAVVSVDGIPPEVTAAEFRFQALPHALLYTFSEKLAASLSASDLVLKNLTTDTTIPESDIGFTNVPALNMVTFSYLGGTSILPDGHYQATLAASAVTDSSGNTLEADHVFDFFFFNGDANRDRKVDFADLVILAQNYGQSGKTFAQGDFSFNTTVGFEDLIVLAQRYGTTLPPDDPEILSVSRRSDEPVFNVASPIRRPNTPVARRRG